MPSDWQTMTLAEAGVRLIDCDHRTPPAAAEGYPYIAIPQLKDGHVELDGVRRISREHLDEWTKKLRPREHDVIVVRRCNSGVSAVVPRGVEWAIGQNLVVLRADGSHVRPEFLRWLTRGDEWWEQVRRYMNVGAVFDSLKCRDIPKFEVLIPPLPEQVSICEVLNALDDRIDLLRQTNATLESIAHALFKSWFIDFDPVRAKAEGREPEDMDGETATLFAAEFEESPLGLIPKGWAVTAVDSVAKIIKGRSYKSSELAESKTALVTLKSFERGGGFRLDGFKSYTGTYKPDQIVQVGECIVAFTDVTQQAEVIGRAALVLPSRTHSNLVASLDVGIVRPSADRLSSLFVYFLLQGERYVSHIRGFTSGTTVLHLAKEGVPSFRFALPPFAIVQTFTAIAQALWARRVHNETMQLNLAALRDSLLSRLLSGKLRLREAQAELEEAFA